MVRAPLLFVVLSAWICCESLRLSHAGEEQIKKGLRLSHAREEQIKAVVVQYDSRKPLPYEHGILTEFNRQYWSKLPGHKYVLFDNDSFEKEDAESLKSVNKQEDCAKDPNSEQTVGPDGCMLHAAWGKVKAMVKATEMYPQAEYFLFMDSDMVMNYKYNQTKNFNVPDLYWGIAFTNDGMGGGKEQGNGEHTFYVAAAPWNTEEMLKDTGYHIGVNSGALVWKNSKKANDALKTWWKSSLDDYNFGVAAEKGFTQPFRTGWPWEQNRLVAIMNEPAYKDTGVLFSSIPARENFYVEHPTEQCKHLYQFVGEVPYQSDYACPLLHYTGPNGGMDQLHDNEIVQHDISEMKKAVGK